MDFDSTALRERIAAIFGAERDFANALGISSRTLSKRLNGIGAGFTAAEIKRAKVLLGLTDYEVQQIFFPKTERGGVAVG